MLNIYIMFLYKSTNNKIFNYSMKKITKKILIYIIYHKRLHKLKFVRKIYIISIL